MCILKVDSGNVCISIPMCFKRESGMQKGIVAKAAEKTIDERELFSNVIVRTWARALAWTQILDRGQVANVTDLAEALKLDRSKTAKHIRLATLSPRILRAVINGTAPDGISLQKLIDIKSDVWSEQEREIGLV